MEKAIRAKNRKYHYIYKITRFDGKYYIGLHSTDNLEDGYFGSGTYLAKSKRKHGLDKHKMEILEFLPDRESLKLREKALVCTELLEDKMCMNLKIGGGGGGRIWSENHKEAMIAGAIKKLNAYTFEERCAMAKKGAITKKENGFVYFKNSPRRTGLSQSVEEQEKRKATFKNNGHAQGCKNSQFGTCWVTNGIQTIKIKKEQLEEYIANGFKRGR